MSHFPMMTSGKNVLRFSAGLTFATLAAIAFCYSTAFQSQPWSDASQMGTVILVGLLVPVVFLAVEFVHLMMLACFLPRFRRGFAFHLSLLAFIGAFIWFAEMKIRLESLAMPGLAGTAVFLVAGTIVYFREWRLAAA